MPLRNPGGGSIFGGRRKPSLINLGSSPFTDHQKLALDARAAVVHGAGSFIHPDISFYNPPSDSRPFIVTPNPFPAYPLPGAMPVVVITYKVQQGLLAVITKLAVVHVGGNPPDGTGQVIWRVLQNGAGIRGLNNLTSEVGTYAQPNDGFSIVGVENDVFQVTVELPATLNGAPNAPMPIGATTAARFQGWTYPLSEATIRTARQQR